MDNLNPGVAVHPGRRPFMYDFSGVKETNGDMVTTALLGCMESRIKTRILQMIH